MNFPAPYVCNGSKPQGNLDPDENDVIFIGDFNAPPAASPPTKQTTGISEMMGDFASNLQFVISDKPTNILQTKIYDNIFFDADQTSEYIRWKQGVVRVDETLEIRRRH